MAKTKKVKLDTFHYHEALDRCNSINNIIQEMLLDHPVISQNKKWYDLIDAAQGYIGKVYQEIGSRK